MKKHLVIGVELDDPIVHFVFISDDAEKARIVADCIYEYSRYMGIGPWECEEDSLSDLMNTGTDTYDAIVELVRKKGLIVESDGKVRR